MWDIYGDPPPLYLVNLLICVTMDDVNHNSNIFNFFLVVVIFKPSFIIEDEKKDI